MSLAAFRSSTAVVLVVAGLLASCAAWLDRRVEAIVLEALPRLVGPADEYVVTARGATPEGDRIDELRASGRRVRRERMPVLDRVDLVLKDIVIDRATRRVVSIGRADAAVFVTAADLGRHLQSQDWIEDPLVRVEAPADIVVSGRLKVPGVPFLATPQGEFRGRLVPRESELLMRVSALSLGDRQAPVLLRAILEQAINPVFDTARYAVPSRIDAVTVQGEALVLQASGAGTMPVR